MTNKNPTPFTSADAVVQELVLAEVEVIFGIVSIHNMPIYDAILREGSIELVTARGESGAVNMADGYARSTGKLGVVLTSTGTGAGNAAGSLIESWSAGAPLLHITGEVASNYLGTGQGYIHECKDQLKMMEGASKKAIHLKIPEQTSPVVRNAIYLAHKPPEGPVTVEIPIDYQSTIVSNNMITDFVSTEDSVLFPDIPKEVIEKIKSSKRPIIWAGGGAISSNASTETKLLAEKLGAAVITSQSGKGTIPEDHSLCIGHFASYPEVKDFLNNADLLISIGVRFRGNETSNWNLEVPVEHIAIDVDLNAINRNYTSSNALVGEAKNIIQQILNELPENLSGDSDDFRQEVKKLREEIRKKLRKTLGPYETILDDIRHLKSESSIVVRDITVPANVWGSRLIETYKPRTSIHASGGGIGQGLPTAIGAQIGNKEEIVILIAGDGGFMVNVGEMAVAAQEKLPLIIILFDDSGYGVIRNIQEEAYGRTVGVDLESPDFALLAQSMGFDVEKTKSHQEFHQQFKNAVNNRRPSMIVIDMESVGPMAEPFKGPPGVAKTFQPKKL